MNKPRAGGPLSTDDTPAAVLSVAEAARYLHCDRKTIYASVSKGELPALKLGRAIRISRAVLDRMLEGDKP